MAISRDDPFMNALGSGLFGGGGISHIGQQQWMYEREIRQRQQQQQHADIYAALQQQPQPAAAKTPEQPNPVLLLTGDDE